jgi:hypothetical protein
VHSTLRGILPGVRVEQWVELPHYPFEIEVSDELPVDDVTDGASGICCYLLLDAVSAETVAGCGHEGLIGRVATAAAEGVGLCSAQS